MPPPSSENDLKRHARRRLIGAVALTLVAVIVLPLLLEDEPPPSSPLAVRMAAVPEALPEQPEPSDATEGADVPPAPEPKVGSGSIAETERKADSKVEPAQADAAKPTPRPQPPESVAPAPVQAKSTAASEAFVVQLAALSDPAKADALKGRAVLAGLPAYTDKLGELTRVRVGPYSSREAAETAAKKLADNGFPAGQVVAK